MDFRTDRRLHGSDVLSQISRRAEEIPAGVFRWFAEDVWICCSKPRPLQPIIAKFYASMESCLKIVYKPKSVWVDVTVYEI